VVALVCAVTGAVSLWIAYRQTWIAVGFERVRLSYLDETIERLDLDEPYWIDAREFGRTAPSGRSATSGNACER
jgi:hypothetical protein